MLDAVARDYALRECEEVIDFLTRADGGEWGERWGDGRMGTRTRTRAAKTKTKTRRQGKRRDEISREEEEEEEAPLPPRDGRGLESLLASTMRVHGSKTTVVPSADAAGRRRRDDDDAFDETEMTTTTATATATPVPAPSSSMPSMAMSSLGASTTTTYENTNAGARKPSRRTTPQLDAIRSGLVDVNGKDSSGMTLLHLACLFNRASAVETLLELGADPELRNAQGETATDVAPTTPAFASRGL